MSQIETVTFEDELWEGVDETIFRTMTNIKRRHFLGEIK